MSYDLTTPISEPEIDLANLRAEKLRLQMQLGHAKLENARLARELARRPRVSENSEWLTLAIFAAVGGGWPVALVALYQAFGSDTLLTGPAIFTVFYVAFIGLRAAMLLEAKK